MLLGLLREKGDGRLMSGQHFVEASVCISRISAPFLTFPLKAEAVKLSAYDVQSSAVSGKVATYMLKS